MLGPHARTSGAGARGGQPDLTPVASFTEVVGREHVLTDADVVASYVVDWTGRFRGRTEAVVRPGSVAEVAGVVAVCRDAGIALTLQGGNTGLVGGSVPLSGEIVLSLTRLKSLGDVDVVSGQVTAGCGVTIGGLQRAAAVAGWSYGVDLASRDSASVGGTIATNAGGLRVLRYGDTRAQLLGVEAVLGDGSVISHLDGLWKDNTGYDFGGLLCGSEGTLGVVTAARLRLVSPAPARAVALLAFDDVGAAVVAAAGLRRWVALLEAVELFLGAGMSLVCSQFGLESPFPAAEPYAAYVLVEAAGDADPTDALASAVDSLAGVCDVALGSSGARRAMLWRYREAHTEAIARIGIAHKLDVAVPLGLLRELVSRVPGVVESVAPGAVTWLFGHAADGNLHVNITGADPADDAVDGAVLELVSSLGGSISAEHGIGVAKRQWLALNRSAAELAAMRAVKRALDPAGILSPNVLV
jgi:FAD/FMN-containing dehydrogenase